MVVAVSGLRQHIPLAPEQLLFAGECLVVVDDDPDIRESVCEYLSSQGFPVEGAGCSEELFAIMARRQVALVLLDIGLPGRDGRAVLREVVERSPDAAVVMLTGVADLKVAMACIREGADDFLAKPADFSEIQFVVRRTLEKRRLVFENRRYQEDLENAHFRINVLHHLSIKMNTAYLSTVEVDEILQAVLVGITAREGLGFNRAFLAMFNRDASELAGHLAIGPACHQEAARIWSEMEAKQLAFLDIVQTLRDTCHSDTPANRIVRQIRVPAADRGNILIRAIDERRSIKVLRENGSRPLWVDRRARDGRPPEGRERRSPERSDPPMPVPEDLIRVLGCDSFVVVPLFSPRKPFGVIIVDNFVTGAAITDGMINAVELFASQASLAIEHSHLYQEMNRRLEQLEELNEELDRSRDLLVAMDRYAALGQMGAQLVHAIRNPITAIGGVARLMGRRTDDPEMRKYLEVITQEARRIEATLNDLSDFVQTGELNRERVQLSPLLRKTLVLVRQSMEKSGVGLVFEVDDGIAVTGDAERLRQMFLHLFRNAVEAMADGGTLTVRAAVADGSVRVEVDDTGIGMKNGHVEHATDPFFTTKTYGTGMGLSLVAKIAEAHGGAFSFRSKPEGGMVATVTLPLAAARGRDAAVAAG